LEPWSASAAHEGSIHCYTISREGNAKATGSHVEARNTLQASTAGRLCTPRITDLAEVIRIHGESRPAGSAASNSLGHAVSVIALSVSQEEPVETALASTSIKVIAATED
jgi:hypothetical protein